MQSELRLLFPGHELQFQRGTCADSAVALSIRDSRSDVPADVLGLAHRRNDGIAPRIELFLQPIMRYSGATGWETAGRALARVAAHELLHYLQQSSGHAEEGLLRAKLSRDDLVSEFRSRP